MEGLQGTEANRALLDEWMEERRLELRLRWGQVARRADMSTQNLLRIRKGQIGISWEAADGIEEALQWKRGSVEAAVLRGVKPTVMAAEDPSGGRSAQSNGQAVTPNASEQRPTESAVDPDTGTFADLQRELAYFRKRLKDEPTDFPRLLVLLDLAARLYGEPPDTQSSARSGT